MYFSMNGFHHFYLNQVFSILSPLLFIEHEKIFEFCQKNFRDLQAGQIGAREVLQVTFIALVALKLQQSIVCWRS